MEKKDQKAPEEIARDLESIDFAEIDEADLKSAFGALETPDCGGSNTNCPCGW